MTYYSALHYAAKAEKSASEAALHNLKNKITNCITEIPQDIKLELVDGALTLKAGSKVYVPNGAGKFDVKTTTQDCLMSGGIGGNNTKIFIAYKDNAITSRPVSQSVSGAGATTSGGFAFDTTANKINFYNASGGLQSESWSFPVAIVSTDSSGVASSIDQVFNGFGYIGSTVFALPGVEILGTDGRNTDGTLKNKKIVFSSILTTTFTDGISGGEFFYDLRANRFYNRVVNIVKSLSDITTNGNYYVENENLSGWATDGALYSDVRAILGKISTKSTGVITSFTPKTTFHAVDYQEVEGIVNNLTKHVVVSTLPSSPDADTFYYIPEV
jgi:hypothetical protein